MTAADVLPSLDSPRRSHVVIAIAALVLLVLATFGRTVTFGYVNWDDQETIFENPVMLPPGATAFAEAWTKTPMAIYMPVTRTAWAVLALAGGHADSNGFVVNPVPFRVFGLAVHVASTLLVFSILRRIVGDRHWFAAAIGAAVFAVHPLQVESVTWISGQKDLLAGLFTLLAVQLAMSAADATDARRPAWLGAVWLAGAMAMLSKPQAMVAPAVIALVLAQTGVPWRRALAMVTPLILLAGVTAAIARNVQPADAIATTPLWTRPIVALDAIGWYLVKLVAPLGLTLDYGRNPAAAWQSSGKWLFAGIALAAVAASICRARKHSGFASGLLIGLCGVAPVLGLVPFDFQQYSTVADHYVYIAMFGIAIALTLALVNFDRVAMRGAAAGVIVALAAMSVRQAEAWRDSDRLFAHCLEENPTSLAANRVLGFFASRRGDDRLAITYLETALAHHPGNAIANYNLANAHVRLGEVTTALPAFEAAIAAAPSNAAYRHNYAIALIRAGRPGDAEAQLKRAIALDPRMTASREALARLHAMQGKPVD